MITGDIKKIDLGISSFERMITEGNLYVDKTRMIEHFFNFTSSVQLVARQRRLGKSLNMDMLRCFLTDKEDLRHLFKGLYIETSPVWEKANSAPAFYFDFKRLTMANYKEVIYDTICGYIDSYCDGISHSRAVRRYLDTCNINDTEGLHYLTESVYKATGKRCYLLIDEYDKLFMDAYNTEQYEDVRSFMTAVFSSGLKGNYFLEKALLTGVMRISYESIFSGLNNIVTFDAFDDNVYTDDYGFTEAEIEGLNKLADFDINELRKWYNGMRIGGHAIYNTYSVMSYLARGNFVCFWGKSGTMGIIENLLNDERRETLTRLLNGESVDVAIGTRVSLRHLTASANDQAFYSFLVQGGYLTLEGVVHDVSTTARVFIPNTELMIVWKQFILETLSINVPKIKTLFDNADNLEIFSHDLEYFLRDRLSYHDLAVHKYEEPGRTHERIYHVFMLGILSAYDDVRCHYPLSNRESGYGRYDILVERPAANFIFEFKAGKETDNLEEKAAEALTQIEIKRYGTDLHANKRLVKVGIAFYGKMCKVRCK